jgi:hypothetical protein
MIIGISGKIGSGKDLVGQMVQYIGETGKHAGWGAFEVLIAMSGEFPSPTIWKHKKFADALKDNVCRLLGCTREQLEDRAYKEKELGEEWWYYDIGTKILPYGYYKRSDKKIADERYLVKPTPRLILQRLGTEGVRDVIHPNAWVNAAMVGYKDGFSHGDEQSNWYFTDMRFPNELDAVAIRGGITIRIERGDGNTGDHESETALDDSLDKFDYVVDNNGTMEDLFYKIHSIMKDFNLIEKNYEDSIRY